MLLSLALGIAWASGDWSGAKSKADDYNHKRDELHKVVVQETKKLVAAACIAEHDERSRGDDAASSARSRVGDKFNEAEHAQRDAIDMLERVINDDSLKSNRDEARKLQSDVKSTWEKIKDQSREVREHGRDIVDGFVRESDSAKHDRQGRCDAKDVSLSAGHAACLMASGSDTCKVVEFAADDSSSISKARERGSRFRSQLERFEGDTVKHLIDKKSEFAKCKHYEVRVDCLRACPDVSDEGQIRSHSTSWREGC
ncbi:MAG TPA: hypothetical protein VGO00_07865 [Kofleriaceae bacterium]|nr:hypothetical protein [Kofleriaceae bacterium]